MHTSYLVIPKRAVTELPPQVLARLSDHDIWEAMRRHALRGEVELAFDPFTQATATDLAAAGRRYTMTLDRLNGGGASDETVQLGDIVEYLPPAPETEHDAGQCQIREEACLQLIAKLTAQRDEALALAKQLEQQRDEAQEQVRKVDTTLFRVNLLARRAQQLLDHRG